MSIGSILGYVPLAFLVGCASLPSNAPPFTPALRAPDDYATVYFYRVGAYPKLRTPDVLIGGIKVYEPPELAYTWVYVKAGERKFRVQWARDTGWPPVEFARALTAGESYYIKISGSFEDKGLTSYNTITHVLGSWAELIPARQAEAELSACCKYIKSQIARLE